MGRVKAAASFGLQLVAMLGATFVVEKALRWRGLLGSDVTLAQNAIDTAIMAALYWLVWHVFTWPQRARMRRLKSEITELEMQRLRHLAENSSNVVSMAAHAKRAARAHAVAERLKQAADALHELASQ